jgi:hypothetical protein
MFSKLRFWRKASFICQIEIQISTQIYKYLEHKFKLTKRYEQKDALIKEFNLFTDRKISDFTTICVDPEYFMSKLHSKKDAINNNREIKGLKFLKLKFRKREIISQ